LNLFIICLLLEKKKTLAATYKTSGQIVPSFLGGVEKIISLQPATVAGIPNIYAVEGRT